MEHPARVGKYAIEKFLGGSMSNVYRAKDTVLGRQVAIKILTKEGAASLIRVLRPDEDGGELHHGAVRELPKDDPIRTDFSAISSFPVGTLQRLHIAPLRVVLRLKLVNGALKSFPHIAREIRKLFLGFSGKFNAIAHL
jgi:serine/threonine protein kinase